jgi:hypothetical protein
MPGIRALHKVYLGREALAGAATDTVTVVWRGTGVMDDNRETVFPDENIGILGGVNRSYVPMTGSEITLEGDATFEQLPYILGAAMYRETAASDNLSSGFIRAYDWQVTAADPIETTDLATLVIEGGDNQRMERARFGFVRELVLSGAAGEAWQVSGTLQMRELADIATLDLTASSDVTLQTVETMLFSKTKIYIDPSSDTPGTTEKSNTLLNASLNLTTGWQAMMTASGRLDFSDIKHVGGEGTLEVTFEHDGSATAEIGHWRNQNERVVRLLCTGSTYSTTAAGATYDGKTFVIDAFGKWENFEPLGEQDGNNIVTGTLRIGTSTATDERLQIKVVNEIETLP